MRDGRKLALALCAAAGIAAPAAARAATYDFAYHGTGSFYQPDAVATGTGSVTATSSGAFTDFTFTFTLASSSQGGTDSFTYGLADLTTSDITLSGGVVTGLSFSTDYQPGYYFPNETFSVLDLGKGDAASSNFDVGPISIGTVSLVTASIPEPMTVSVLATGLAGLGIVRRRRRIG